MFHAVGQRAALDRHDLERRLKERGSLWIAVVGDDAEPWAASGDALEVEPCGARSVRHARLHLIDRAGGIALETGVPDHTAIALVRRVRRRGRTYSVDHGRWRIVFGTARMRRVHPLIDVVEKAGQRALRLADLFRRPPSVEASERSEAVSFAEPMLRDAYKASVEFGLWESEANLADRYFVAADRILDIGCGTGREAIGFAKRGVSVVAIDVCGAAIETAKIEARSRGVEAATEFQKMGLSELSFDADRFDACFLSAGVYESTPGRAERVRALERCRRVTRPGGHVVIAAKIYSDAGGWTTRVIDRQLARLSKLAGRWVLEPGDRYIRYGFAEAAPMSFRHSFRSEAELVAEIEAAGMTLVDCVMGHYVARVPERRFRRAGDVMQEELNDGALLVQRTTGFTFTLNRTGKKIWDLVAEGRSELEIASLLGASSGEGNARSYADAARLLEELEKNHLIEAVRSVSRPSGSVAR